MTKKMSRLNLLLSHYKTKQLIIAFAIFWLPILIFAKIANEIVEHETIKSDVAILTWFHSFSSPALDTLFLIFTTLGNLECIVPATFAIFAWLLYKKQRLNAAVLLVGVGGGAMASFLLKLIFQRARPSFWHSIVTETSYSFPSGHAMISCALALCLVFILWKTRWRAVSIILGASVVILIGLSRLYWGVHYPTDIIAGWCVSSVWVIVVVGIMKGFSYRHRRASQFNHS